MAANREITDHLPVVIDYLESNPNFFLDNPTLLSNLHLPHISGRNISSLIEYQVMQLRENEQLLKSQLDELINKQKQNETLAECVHAQVLSLANIQSIEELYDKTLQFLKREYQCSHLMMFLFSHKRPYPDYRDLRFKPIHSKLRYLFSGLYNTNKSLCDSLPTEYIDALFDKHAAKIKSTVTLPILNEAMPGLLILGSEQYNSYEHGFCIKLLEQIKDLFVQRLTILLETSETRSSD